MEMLQDILAISVLASCLIVAVYAFIDCIRFNRRMDRDLQQILEDYEEAKREDKHGDI